MNQDMENKIIHQTLVEFSDNDTTRITKTKCGIKLSKSDTTKGVTTYYIHYRNINVTYFETITNCKNCLRMR